MHNERCCEESVCSSSVQLCASLSKFFGGEDRVADSLVLWEKPTLVNIWNNVWSKQPTLALKPPPPHLCTKKVQKLRLRHGVETGNRSHSVYNSTAKKFGSSASFAFHRALVMRHKRSGSRGLTHAKTKATALPRIQIRASCNRASGDRQFGSTKWKVSAYNGAGWQLGREGWRGVGEASVPGPSSWQTLPNSQWSSAALLSFWWKNK